MNLWVHDGSKDVTVNRMKYRELFKDSLDRIFATEYKNMKDCLESKVFGIGLESYTVGSNEFCVGYSVQHRETHHYRYGTFSPDGKCRRQSIVYVVVRSGIDASCQPADTLGFRPCDYYG